MYFFEQIDDEETVHHLRKGNEQRGEGERQGDAENRPDRPPALPRPEHDRNARLAQAETNDEIDERGGLAQGDGERGARRRAGDVGGKRPREEQPEPEFYGLLQNL